MMYFVLTHRAEICNPSSPSEGLVPAITAILLLIQIPHIHIQYEYSVLVSAMPFHCYSVEYGCCHRLSYPMLL
jgi:hypothetical protein